MRLRRIVAANIIGEPGLVMVVGKNKLIIDTTNENGGNVICCPVRGMKLVFFSGPASYTELYRFWLITGEKGAS